MMDARDMRWTTCHSLHGFGVALLGEVKLRDIFSKTSGESDVTGVACDSCFMGDSVESDAMNEHGGQWVTAIVVPR